MDSVTVEDVEHEYPPLLKGRGGTGAMDTDDQWGEEKVLMEKFLEDFDLDGILDDPRNDDDARGSVSTGPNKRGRTIKKRRKQGISPTDPRKFYTDRLVNALCSGDIEKVRVVMERYHEPDCVYIQRFTNNTPDLPAYREIHGREQMLAFHKAFLASSPDCVVKVTDRQLNVYQDGSSYLVSKMNFSGAWLFRIFFSNIIRRTRSFLNRTFFNRPTIINPFRPKGASSSSSSTSSTNSSLSATSIDSSAASTTNDKESSTYLFASFRRKKSAAGAAVTAAAMMAEPPMDSATAMEALPPLPPPHSSLSHSTDQDVASPLSSHSYQAAEESPSIRYLHGDMHLVEGKASDYESDARPPTPLSPLSTASSQMDVAPPSRLPPPPPPPSSSPPPTQLSPTASSSSAAAAVAAAKVSSRLANVDADVVVEGPPEVLEAEAPWDDLPFTIVRDEPQSSTPVPAPAALIVTPESKVSIVTAQPKPYRVNVAISHVAHINPAGRIFKIEMFLKAEVSISWWAAAKNKAGTTEDLEPLPEEDDDLIDRDDNDDDDGVEGDDGAEAVDHDEEGNETIDELVDGPVVGPVPFPTTSGVSLTPEAK